jgi:pyruvate,water dikinase
MSCKFENSSTSNPAVGNKALRLAQLRRAGFRVPDFFVVIADGCAGRDWHLSETAALESHLGRLGGRNFAVRSSSVDEDLSGSTFAGQFDSFLEVAAAEVGSRCGDVVASVNNPHLIEYFRSRGFEGEISPPAVIVQRMIRADVAGVAFAADPVSGDPNVVSVAAVRGTGEKLVSGEAHGESWRVGPDRNPELDRDDHEAGPRPVMTRRQVRKVARLVRKVTKVVGCPQDIEWAIDGSRLYLLQSRDITAMGSPASPGEHYALWDNSNIVESYGGVTTPLTFSVARTAYREAYRHYCLVVGMRKKVVEDNTQTFEQMIGLLNGRVYYNLLNWYRLLMLTPGFRYNRRFMEQMMGVTEGLPAGVLPAPRSPNTRERLLAVLGIVRVGWRMSSRLPSHERRVARFHRRIDEALAPRDLAKSNLSGLLGLFDELQSRVIPAWDTPLLNDMYCMIFHGLLRVLTRRWLPADLSELHNELVAGEAGIVSMKPVRQMHAIADIIAKQPGLAEVFATASQPRIEAAMADNDALKSACKKYLEAFGDRCLDELKLESATLSDDPMPLYRSVGQLAKTAGMATRRQGEDTRDQDPESRLQAALAESPLRLSVYRWVLLRARHRVRDRENLRFERTRVYGRVRQIFVEIGKRLADRKELDNPDDIFYLDLNEIRSHVYGNGTAGEIRVLVRSRRLEYHRHRDEGNLPRRFVTCGPPQAPGAIVEVSGADTEEGLEQLVGQGCSAGVVRGRVNIVRDPRQASIKKGDIVVAERTDPGWVTVFPLVGGMIMERGSLLSHSAIVAREMGIPAVVGVSNACAWLQNGEWVEIDGASGVIRRLCGDEVAA